MSFLPDIVVDAELPAQMNAAKRQQFRWAKGSIQCATKLLFDITVKRKFPLRQRFKLSFNLHVILFIR